MITILVQWALMVTSAYLWGLGIMKIANISKETKAKHLDITMFLGLCFLTVYAEIFSLIMRVGFAALVIMTIVNVALIVVNRKEIAYQLKQLKAVKWYTYVGIGLITIVLMMMSSRRPLHYDTYLYHAQSVRWIEEYGIVPGLGNLHNRIAYNSAIFCLDALMGLKPLLNQNIHGVDGFFEVILLSYAIFSFKGIRKKKFFTSDALRVGLFIFLTGIENLIVISSLGSDIPALGLMMYIIIKWISLVEDNKDKETFSDEAEQIQLMSLLCVLAVYGMSIKLTVAMITLLTIHPVVEYLKNKNYREIIKYLLLGTIVIVPFLIRNVIISGYLIYPYPEIDLFNVDWKMNAYTCLFDRYEIQAWGRELNNVYKFDAKLGEWFPIWWKNLTAYTKVFFVTNILAMLVVLIAAIVRVIKAKKTDILALSLAIAASCLLWFNGSPDARYGGVFVSIAPLCVFGYAIAYLCVKIKETKVKGYVICALSIVLLAVLLAPYIRTVISGDNTNIKRCEDYEWKSGELIQLGDQMMFVPETGDQVGYNVFPAVTYRAMVEKIEFRGDTVKQGFRIKAQYQDAFLPNNGNIDDKNYFEK